MHHNGMVRTKRDNSRYTFNSRFLGIFPCISPTPSQYVIPNAGATFNSRSLGFFHASPETEPIWAEPETFQFPLPWDFSMHQTLNTVTSNHPCNNLLSFNSRYLGIFPCIVDLRLYRGLRLMTFNSRYLGFFHASYLLTE